MFISKQRLKDIEVSLLTLQKEIQALRMLNDTKVECYKCGGLFSNWTMTSGEKCIVEKTGHYCNGTYKYDAIEIPKYCKHCVPAKEVKNDKKLYKCRVCIHGGACKKSFNESLKCEGYKCQK